MVIHATDSVFRGSARFAVRACLGEGGHGVVYEAWDALRHKRVALKVLQRVGPRALLHFKREFRALLELRHPNLVQLDELFETEGLWYFTMELVEGTDLRTHVGAFSDSGTLPLDGARSEYGPGQDDFRQLRNAFGQLAQALRYLHGAGKVHRDIKPSNIRVTGEGRLVLLDFGLIADVDPAGDQHSTGDRIAGTVAYMAPEQCAGGTVGPAADCYALGVMLYEVLGGQLPYSGAPLQVLTAKQTADPPSLRELAPWAPDELIATCHALLCRDPAGRPTAGDLARLLTPNESVARMREPLRLPLASEPLFGREADLALLERALADTLSRRELIKVRIQGESGIGKTALVRAFQEGIEGAHPDCIVLSGRCYEQESVPYKAIDAAIDGLSSVLGRFSREECARLLPRHATLLPHVFPVLGRVHALADAQRAPAPADPFVLRSQVFSALRELLQRIAERRPLVLVLDDLQWTDIESIELLEQVLAAPDAPPLLLVAMLWPEAQHRSEAREAIVRLFGDEATRTIELGPLAPESSRALAKHILRSSPGVRAAGRAEWIARESAGHPLFIDRLARSGARDGGRGLEGVLEDDLALLGPSARRVLELVAVGGAALAESVLAGASALPPAEFAVAVADLRARKLLRSHKSANETCFEPYHARVCAFALGTLDAAARARCHGDLARALEGSAAADPEAIANHLALSGSAREAVRFALLAAEAADRALAFKQAARLYRRALELLGAATDDECRLLRIRLGHALANAGRGADAAEAYLAALPGAGAHEALELRRLAAEHLLRAGRLEPGLREAEQLLLQSTGVKLPSTRGKQLVALLHQRLLLRLRGLDSIERKAADLPATKLLVCDILWSVASSLGTMDQARGSVLYARASRLALDLGEPSRVARALAFEGMWGVAGDAGQMLRSRGAIARAETLAHKVDDPHVTAFVSLAWAYFHMCFCELADCLRRAEHVLDILGHASAGASWHAVNARLVALIARWSLGYVSDLGTRFNSALREAEERGDLYAATSLIGLIRAPVAVIEDRPDAAQEQIEATMERWPAGATLQHTTSIGALVMLDLYRGGPAAHERMERAWPALERSAEMAAMRERIVLTTMRAFAALAALEAGASQARSIERIVLRCAKRLQREHVPDASASARLLHAQLAAYRGELEEAERGYNEALAAYQALGMVNNWRMASQRLAELIGGDEGKQRRLDNLEWAKTEGVKSPERLFGMLGPITRTRGA